MSHRWMKFWPQDWEGDVALRVVSLSAQGLWMRLLCAMHRAEPYGHLVMNGQAMTTRQIASLASITEREAGKLLSELQEAGVLSRTLEGVIFSRRMVRDHEHSEAGKQAVERRWAKANDGRGAKAPPTETPITPPITPPNSLEAEADTDRVIHFVHNSRARKPRLPQTEPNGFAEFWNHYPAKIGKAAARKAWPRAVQQAGGDPAEIVLALKARLHLFPEDAQYIPNPATWLNQGRWDDDPETLFARNQRSA
jgi:hypothetical protein